MILIANALVMNGGTTFILRIAREYHGRGRRCAILLLSDRRDPALSEQLERYADILPLRDFLWDRGVVLRGLLGVFGPLSLGRLSEALKPYGNHIHAMSVFGLILGRRIVTAIPAGRLTIGVYHQNEFLFRAPQFYFATESVRQFSSIPSENIIFFNEVARDNYSKHFGHDYAASANLTPIGISLEQPPAALPAKPGRRIVSIGNLEAFKTYNRHIIGVVAALTDKYPDIRYDIYGVGPTEASLAALTRDLGCADRVTLRGPLDYFRLRETIAECDLFVGSGTALIEAAAVGRPAMIGIESIEESETYGYLSDAHGYSYNENSGSIPKHRMLDLVDRLFSDCEHWADTARKCAEKAQEFSVSVTADGFDSSAQRALPFDHSLPKTMLVRLALSAIMLKVSGQFGWSEPFGDRRNQSY